MPAPPVDATSSWLVNELISVQLYKLADLVTPLAEFQTYQPQGSAGALARYLIQIGLLTTYQVDFILKGEISKLALGPYLIVRPLGSGCLGNVFLAIHRTKRKQFAVKVLPLRSLWNVQQAKKQVQVFTTLKPHPAVVPFVDIDSSAGSHYLVWPYVQGKSIWSLIEPTGTPLPVSDTVRVMTKVAEGLAYCHAHNIAHGLMKPSNVLVGPEQSVQLLDCGMGAILSENIADDESMLDTISTANAAMGMIDCSPPETLNDPAIRTPAGDIYSFGCVMYYMLTGSLPFPDGNVIDKIIAHQTQPPRPVRSRSPGVPIWLEELVDHLLEKDPANRPENLDVVAVALAQNKSLLRPARTQSFVPNEAVTPTRAIVFPAQSADLIAPPTPSFGEAHSTTPWPPKKRTNKPQHSHSEIDFGSFTPPDETTDRESDPIEPNPQYDERLPLDEVIASGPRPIVISSQGILARRSAKRSQTLPDTDPVPIDLPNPVSYRNTDSAGMAVPIVIADQPKSQTLLSRWHRFLDLVCFWRRLTSSTVQLSVFGPTEVSAGQSIELHVFAHTPEAFDSVCTLSRAVHLKGDLRATGQLDHPVTFGANLRLHLHVVNGGVSQSAYVLPWKGQSQPRVFKVHIPWESPAGPTTATLTAGTANVVEATISFSIKVRPRRS